MSNKPKPTFCKDVYLCYFSLKVGSKTEYVCKCGKQRIASNGYSNLKSHIEQEHPEWPEAYQAFLNGGKGPMDIYVKRASKKAENLHSWIEWVVQGMHPPTFVENQYTRKYSNLESICRKTASKYMEKVFCLYFYEAS